MKNKKNGLLMYIISFLKKKIDRIYYSEYTMNRETLIRQMFPGLNAIGEYKKINEYIASHSFEEVQKIIEILYSFYRGEITILVHSGKDDDVKYLKGILDFALALERFRYQYLSEKESEKNI